jgi:mRNA-degrading endonuclease toxin of MazEF toxin-antitoxin module
MKYKHSLRRQSSDAPFKYEPGEVWISRKSAWNIPSGKPLDPEHEKRPILIIAPLAKDAVLIVPGSSTTGRGRFREIIPTYTYEFLHKRTVFICEEIKRIQKADLNHPIGRLDQEDLELIVDKALSYQETLIQW